MRRIYIQESGAAVLMVIIYMAVLHGMAFVAKWQTLGSQNQRLIDISTYVKNGQRLYNGVWRQVLVVTHYMAA
jgi:hypothetical protein